MSNVIKFGNGNLLVSVTMNSMVIRQLDAIKEIGNSQELRDIIPTGIFQINLLNKKQIEQFRQLLKNTYLTPVFEFQNFKFDFTNYCRKSVDVMLDQLNWIDKFIPENFVC